MGLKNRGSANIHSGQGEAGMSPCISPEGVRAGVEKKTPYSGSYLGPAVSQGRVEPSVTSGAELRGGKGQFPRKADRL